MNKFVIGLTGGIASGKTKASDFFARMGITVVDADVIAREIVEPGAASLKEIAHHFGDQILLTDGTLNRSKLREIIFSNPAEKQWLNALMHPAIRKETLSQLDAAQSDYVVLVAPLLIENGLEKFVNRVLVVDVDEETQLKRTQARDKVSEEQATAILAAQSSRQVRLSKADDIVENNKTIAELEKQLTRLHNSYLTQARDYKQH